METLPVVLFTLLGGCLVQGFSYCTVPQWEGYQGTVGAIYQNGSPNVVERLTRVSYDLNNTKMALSTSGTTSGVPFKADYIYDYPKGVLYTVQGDHCTKTALTGPFQKQCTPKGSVWKWAKTWLGGGSPEEVIWIFGFTGKQGSIDYHVSFLMYPAVPVMETLMGEINGDPFFQTSNFMNVTLGIKDPSVFIPPSSCNTVASQLDTGIPRPYFGIWTE